MFALVLQEAGSIIIGEKTFGKGISQTSFMLYAAVLNLTVKEFFSFASGRLHGVGVIPDIWIDELSTDDDTSIFDRAIAHLNSRP